jgi:hypothetical protein
MVALQAVALRDSSLVAPGSGDDDDVRDLGALVSDCRPGLLERGDDLASVLAGRLIFEASGGHAFSWIRS